jgi:hypothetical protein
MITLPASLHFAERVIEAVRLSGSANMPQSMHAPKLHHFPSNQRHRLFLKRKVYAPVAAQSRGVEAERLI